MFEILFRGKDQYTGEWVFGNYSGADFADGTPSQHFILERKGDRKAHSVAPETVGQYIGLRDKNLAMAFDGDVTEDEDGNRWVIFRAPGGFGLCRTHEFPAGCTVHFYDDLCGLNNNCRFMKSHEIIGNIIDNPELLRRKPCKAKSKGSS